VHAGRWHPDPGVPVVPPERVSRREARAARKKLKTLRGSKWQDIQAAERLVLKATADAHKPRRIEIGVALLVMQFVALAGAAIAYGVVELRSAIRAATGAGPRMPGGSAGWVEPAAFLLLGAAVMVALLWYGPVRQVRRRLRDRHVRRDLLAGLESGRGHRAGETGR